MTATRPFSHRGLPRAARRLAAVAASVLAVAGIGACASAAPYNPDNLPSDQVAGVNNVCRSVMGLSAGTSDYGACVDSLMRSARRVDRGLRLEAARASCLKQGLQSGSPDFDVCELRSAGAQPVHAMGEGPAMIAADNPGGAKSYAYSSPENVFRREQLSCARIGLDPAERAFTVCVAGLQSALFAADNPAQ
jgi:hypothetical protein